MAENFIIPSGENRKDAYESVLPQIESLIAGEPDLTANLANIAAALKYGMNFFWAGFYLVKEGELVLGPFQGPVACTRIAEGRGVCGHALKQKEAVIVPDVNLFPGHIACSAESKSEIVIPAIVDGNVVLVLDIDSDRPDDFDETDLAYLTKLIRLVEGLYTMQTGKKVTV
jgi:GAF domain-containing protein